MNENEKKSLFHEALAFLVESANINNGTLTIDEIKLALKDVITDDSMYQLVYDYLLENKISITGYIPIAKKSTNDEEIPEVMNISEIELSTEEEDLKEKSFIDMYYEDLKAVGDISAEEELLILKDFIANKDDKISFNRLTESNLKVVTSLIEEYKNKGVFLGDLLQEGNLGLIEGILTYEGELQISDFHNHLYASIKNALNDAVLEQNSSIRVGSHAADRANELDRASITLSKELDRTPTLEELSKYLSLPEDEVERIMKMSLSALTINENIDEDIDNSPN